MHLVDVFEYAASPEEVYAMMTDVEFLERKCKAQYATSYSASAETNDTGATTVANRELPTRGFPDFVRSMVGQSIHVVETVHWGRPSAGGVRQARLVVTMGAAPLRLTGTITLEPGGVGTVVTYDADLTARVPFVGGRIEKAAERPILSGMRKERETGQAWLAGR